MWSACSQAFCLFFAIRRHVAPSRLDLPAALSEGVVILSAVVNADTLQFISDGFQATASTAATHIFRHDKNDTVDPIQANSRMGTGPRLHCISDASGINDIDCSPIAIESRSTLF